MVKKEPEVQVKETTSLDGLLSKPVHFTATEQVVNPGRRKLFPWVGAALIGAGTVATKLVSSKIEVIDPAMKLTPETIRGFLTPEAKRAADNKLVTPLYQHDLIRPRTEEKIRATAPIQFISQVFYTKDRSGLVPKSFVQEWAKMLNNFAEHGWGGTLLLVGTGQLADTQTMRFDLGVKRPEWADDPEQALPRMYIGSFLGFKAGSFGNPTWPLLLDSKGRIGFVSQHYRSFDALNTYFRRNISLPEGEIQSFARHFEDFKWWVKPKP